MTPRETKIDVSYKGKGFVKLEFQVPLGLYIRDHHLKGVVEKDGGYVRILKTLRAGVKIDSKTDYVKKDHSNHNYRAGIDAKAGEYGGNVGGFAETAVETGRSEKQENTYGGNCDWIEYVVGGDRRWSSVSGFITLILEEASASPTGPSVIPDKASAPGVGDIRGLVDSIRGEIHSPTASPSIVTKYLETLRSLVEKGPRYAKKLADVDGIQTTVAAMKKFPSDVDIQMQGIMLLTKESLFDFIEPGIATKIKGSEVISTVVDAMKLHSTEPEIQQFGCDTLGSLAQRDANKKDILAEHAVVTMKAALSLQNEDVSGSVCIALDTLSHGEKFIRLHDEANGLFGVHRIVPANLALLMFKDSASIVEESRQAIADGGGVDKIFSTMETFPDSAMVQCGAVSTLHGLASDKNLKREFNKSTRARHLVSQALETHQNHPIVQARSADIKRVLLNANATCNNLTVLVAGVVLAYAVFLLLG
jgi:hypothetical protein